jgi:hypothetical protein
MSHDRFILSFGVHLPWRGKAARVWVKRPNGARELIFSQRYIF